MSRDAENDRRHQMAVPPMAIGPEDIDPVLGTLVWTSFARLLETDRSMDVSGALLVVDLDRSRSSEVIGRESSRSEMLPLLAEAVQRAVRRNDLVAHIEDWRFAVLLRGASQEVADTVARRIQESVDDTVFLTSAGLPTVRIDIGGAVFDPTSEWPALDMAVANLEAARAMPSGIFVR